MPSGDNPKYTDKHKRKAEHIAVGYEDRGVPEKVAESRAWATVDNESGGGNKSGSGSGKADTTASGEKGSKASSSRTAAERSASAKKAAETRERNREAAKSK